jgi:four helix bundle protein
MTPQELRDRTKRFATDVVRLCKALPDDWTVRVLARQLLRSGTSVAANYRVSNRARSDKEFCAKIGLVLEESDESQLWLELLPVCCPSSPGPLHAQLKAESEELTAIFASSYKTASENLPKRAAERARNRAAQNRR